VHIKSSVRAADFVSPYINLVATHCNVWSCGHQSWRGTDFGQIVFDQTLVLGYYCTVT